MDEITAKLRELGVVTEDTLTVHQEEPDLRVRSCARVKR